MLFIDEIHRLSRQVEEVLYPALEDYALDIMIGKGPSAQSIASTCRALRWWGDNARRANYQPPARPLWRAFEAGALHPGRTAKIVTRSAGILGVPCTPDGALEMARRSRGTPRVQTAF